MTYKKDEYEIDGVEVTVQQVRGPESSMGASEASAWINGGAAYAKDARDLIPIDVSRETEYEMVKTIVAYMVDNGVRYCPKCETLQPMDGFVSTGFAGRKCGNCHTKDTTCDDGGSHSWKCTNPRQKNNARRSTKYKCTTCGKTKKTVPTG